MNILFVFIFIILLILSFVRRTDIFSPFKIYLLNIAVFWGEIFVCDYNAIVNVYFLTILSFGLIIFVLEGKTDKISDHNKIEFTSRKKIWIKLWLLTLIPVCAQLLLIMKMGGIEGYIFSIGLRVKEWSGLGIYIVLIRTISIINLVYFYLIIKLRNTSSKEKLSFYLNLLVFIIIALLSGSRSTLLVNFILMAIVYYYFVKKISVVRFFFIGISALFIAMVIGIARNGYSFKDGELKTGLSNENRDKQVETSNFSYGLFPLEIITEQEYIKSYRLGSTYLSAVTNLVPRSLWSEKPDTGGVVFTTEYYNIHQGYSNYSTGFIVEGIINYGYFVGTIFAYLLLFFIYWLFTSYFKKSHSFLFLRKLTIYDLSYVCFLYLIPTYLHGEFTTVTHSIFINKILVLWFVVYFVIPFDARCRLIKK